jgi:hypothetical protein
VVSPVVGCSSIDPEIVAERLLLVIYAYGTNTRDPLGAGPPGG